MKRLGVLIFLLIGAAEAGESNESRSPSPKVLLRGEDVNELAPHGKGNVYAPDVMRDGKVFRMWYGGQGKDGHDRIAYAESADGMKWVRKGIVLRDDKANHVNDPSVVKVEGKFFMYYTRTEKEIVDRIDVATSTDGLKWETKGVALAPGIEGTWDSLSVGRPSVLVEDGLFKMWYDGRQDFPPDAPVKDVPKSSTSHRSIGYATSKDGLRWSRCKANPVFGNDTGGVEVKRWGSTLLMVSESREGTRLASSTDGMEWRDKGLLAKKSTTKIDLFGHVTPCLLIDAENKRHRLYLGAAGATTWDHNCIAVLPIDNDRLTRFVNGGNSN